MPLCKVRTVRAGMVSAKPGASVNLRSAICSSFFRLLVLCSRNY
jgi:hypothetical protein